MSGFLKPAMPASKMRKPTATINLSGAKQVEKLTMGDNDEFRDRAAERRAGVEASAPPDISHLLVDTGDGDETDSDGDTEADDALEDALDLKSTQCDSVNVEHLPNSVMSQFARDILKSIAVAIEPPRRNPHFELGRMVFQYDWSESRLHHVPTTVIRSQEDLKDIMVCILMFSIVDARNVGQ
jgi:hypothetical protein